MWAGIAQIRYRTGAQDMENCNVTREAAKDKMVLTRGEIFRSSIRAAEMLRLEMLWLLKLIPPHTNHTGTILRMQTEGPCHILCPFLPRSLPNTQTNYGRVYKFRKLIKRHQPFSSFMALWVNRKSSMVHLGPLFSKEILSSAVLQVCTALQWTETP